jgi:hypothetical protein
MAHAQKSDFVFLRNARCHLNRGGGVSPLLAAEVWASAVVMLDTPCSEVMWRVLATHSIRQFPLHFPSRASHFTITFQLDSTKTFWRKMWNVNSTARKACVCWYRLNTRAWFGFVTNSESFVYVETKHVMCIFICSRLSSVIKEVFV